MKKRKADDTDNPQDTSLPVYGQDADGNKKRGFDCILINGTPYIESVSRNGRKVKTPVSAAIAAAEKLKEESSDWN